MNVLAIDPGNFESAYVVVDDERRPLFFGKVPNQKLRIMLWNPAVLVEWGQPDRAAIEMVTSYGMPVGADVFETCVWIGRFAETLNYSARPCALVPRLAVKLHLCKSAQAKDSNIRQALVDRFAKGQRNYGKGTKTNPGWFYGFAADVWQAYALAVFITDEQDDVLPGMDVVAVREGLL